MGKSRYTALPRSLDQHGESRPAIWSAPRSLDRHCETRPARFGP